MFGTDAVERRQTSAEHVIHAAKLPGPLDRSDVRRLLDHADDRRVTARVAADDAERVLGEVEAALARTNPVAEREQRFREAATLFLRLLQQMIREAERRLSTDPRQLRQLRCQIVNRGHTLLNAE